MIELDTVLLAAGLTMIFGSIHPRFSRLSSIVLNIIGVILVTASRLSAWSVPGNHSWQIFIDVAATITFVVCGAIAIWHRTRDHAW